MEESAAELESIAETLQQLVDRCESSEGWKMLDAVEESASDVGRSWSGSWLGYHSCVYYRDLQPPHAGHHFSSEWGLQDTMIQYTIGPWQEYKPEDVEQAVFTKAGNPKLDDAREMADAHGRAFDHEQAKVVSILELESSGAESDSLKSFLADARKLAVPKPNDFVAYMRPAGQLMSRDSLAATQGVKTPPHLKIIAQVMATRGASEVCGELAAICKKAAAHLHRLAIKRQSAGGAGEPESKEPRADASKMTISELVGGLRPAHLWKVVAALLGLLGGAFTLGYKTHGIIGDEAGAESKPGLAEGAHAESRPSDTPGDSAVLELEHRCHWIRTHVLADNLTVKQAWEAQRALDGGGGSFRAADDQYRDRNIEAVTRERSNRDLLSAITTLRRLLSEVPESSRDGQLVEPVLAGKIRTAASCLPGPPN
ncbi:MAG: hypothetical protein ACE37K_19420 [Planctomycetota bacterium]